MDVGNTLGKFFFMEDTMLFGVDKQCAKILVEFDTSIGLPESVEIVWRGSSFVQMVDYLFLPFWCLNCHETGHLINQCTVLLRQFFGQGCGGSHDQRRGRVERHTSQVDTRLHQTGAPACSRIPVDDRAHSSGKRGNTFVPQYDDLSRDVISYIEALEILPGKLIVHSVPSGDSRSVDGGDTLTVIIDDCDSGSFVSRVVALSGPVDSFKQDSILSIDSLPSPGPSLDSPASLTVLIPASTNESPGPPVVELSDSLPVPSDSINDSPQLLASYRDILLAHFPIITDKVSSKPGVVPLGVVKHRNVTIRCIKGRARGSAPTFDPGPDRVSSEYIPLLVRLEMASFDSVSGALRDLPINLVTK